MFESPSLARPFPGSVQLGKDLLMQTRARILVIDDDPMFRNLVVSMLRKDFLVSVAASGEEGYEKAKEHRPDIAVIDIQMPGWSGIETLQVFRSDPDLSKTKTMILTGDASKDTVVAAIQSGANDYVIKTCFSKDEFLQKVGRLVPGIDHAAATSAPQNATAEIADDVSQDWDEPATKSPAPPESEQGKLQEVLDEWD